MRSTREFQERMKELQVTYGEIARMSGLPVEKVRNMMEGMEKEVDYISTAALEQALFGDDTGMVFEPANAYMVKQQGDYTLDDYYNRIPDERRVELIDGVIYDMTAPTSRHQMIAGFLYNQFFKYVSDRQGSCMPMISPLDVQLDCDDRTMVQPDVVIVCDRDKIIDRCIYGAPDLVIEVLSKSTRKKDTVIKLNKYMNAGVREYWMIDPAYKKVIVYDFERDNYPAIYGFDAKVPVGIWNGDLEIDFAEVYEYVRFLYER